MDQPVTVATAQRWGADRDEITRRSGARFARSASRQRMRRSRESLLRPSDRKNGWQLAAAAGEATPYGMQRVLAGAHGDADAVRDEVPAYVRERVGAPAALLVVDETGFLQHGVKAVGVTRPYRAHTAPIPRPYRAHTAPIPRHGRA